MKETSLDKLSSFMGIPINVKDFMAELVSFTGIPANDKDLVGRAKFIYWHTNK